MLGIIWDGMHILAKDNWWGILEIPHDIEVDFAIEVKGDSMIGAGIIEKDYVLCRRVGTAADGSIVVVIEAVDPKYSVATLKYYIVEKGKALLRAANPTHADIPLRERHRIVGVMDSLIRKGSASEGYYGGYLSIKDCYLSEWNEFIETMNKYDIQPSQVKQLIILLLEYSKKLVRASGSSR